MSKPVAVECPQCEGFGYMYHRPWGWVWEECRCICWKGESTEGVLEDCPVHGAMRGEKVTDETRT